MNSSATVTRPATRSAAAAGTATGSSTTTKATNTTNSSSSTTTTTNTGKSAATSTTSTAKGSNTQRAEPPKAAATARSTASSSSTPKTAAAAASSKNKEESSTAAATAEAQAAAAAAALVKCRVQEKERVIAEQQEEQQQQRRQKKSVVKRRVEEKERVIRKQQQQQGDQPLAAAKSQSTNNKKQQQRTLGSISTSSNSNSNSSNSDNNSVGSSSSSTNINHKKKSRRPGTGAAAAVAASASALVTAIATAVSSSTKQQSQQPQQQQVKGTSGDEQPTATLSTTAGNSKGAAQRQQQQQQRTKKQQRNPPQSKTKKPKKKPRSLQSILPDSLEAIEEVTEHSEELSAWDIQQLREGRKRNEEEKQKKEQEEEDSQNEDEKDNDNDNDDNNDWEDEEGDYNSSYSSASLNNNTNNDSFNGNNSSSLSRGEDEDSYYSSTLEEPSEGDCIGENSLSSHKGTDGDDEEEEEEVIVPIEGYERKDGNDDEGTGTGTQEEEEGGNNSDHDSKAKETGEADPAVSGDNPSRYIRLDSNESLSVSSSQEETEGNRGKHNNLSDDEYEEDLDKKLHFRPPPPVPLHRSIDEPQSHETTNSPKRTHSGTISSIPNEEISDTEEKADFETKEEDTVVEADTDVTSERELSERSHEQTAGEASEVKVTTYNSGTMHGSASAAEGSREEVESPSSLSLETLRLKKDILQHLLDHPAWDQESYHSNNHGSQDNSYQNLSHEVEEGEELVPLTTTTASTTTGEESYENGSASNSNEKESAFNSNEKDHSDSSHKMDQPPPSPTRHKPYRRMSADHKPPKNSTARGVVASNTGSSGGRGSPGDMNSGRPPNKAAGSGVRRMSAGPGGPLSPPSNSEPIQFTRSYNKPKVTEPESINTSGTMFNYDDDFDQTPSNQLEVEDEALTWRLDPIKSLSDWTLKVTDKLTREIQCYHVHKNIIAFGKRKSEYFARLFQTQARMGVADKRESVIVMDAIAAAGMPVLLDFIYTTNEDIVPEIRTQTATGLRYLSQFFGVRLLHKQVMEFIVQDICMENLLQYYQDSVVLADEKISQLTAKHCARHILEVETNNRLLSVVDPHFFRRVMSSPEIDTAEKQYHVSNLLAVYCVLNKETLDDQSFKRLTDEKVLPLVDYCAALILMEMEADLVLSQLLPADEKPDITNLQYRCIKDLTTHWKDLTEMDQREVIRVCRKLSSAVVTELLVKSLGQAKVLLDENTLTALNNNSNNNNNNSVMTPPDMIDVPTPIASNRLTVSNNNSTGGLPPQIPGTPKTPVARDGSSNSLRNNNDSTNNPAARKMREMKQAHEAKMANLQKQHEQAMDALKQTMEQQIAAMQEVILDKEKHLAMYWDELKRYERMPNTLTAEYGKLVPTDAKKGLEASRMPTIGNQPADGLVLHNKRTGTRYPVFFYRPPPPVSSSSTSATSLSTPAAAAAPSSTQTTSVQQTVTSPTNGNRIESTP